MVDFTTPNLCGASLDFNKLMSQFDDVKKLLSDNLEAEASALAELLDVDLNVLDVDLRSMVTTLQSIKALNLQSEITSLVGMSAGSSTYVNKLADIAGKFGTGLSAGGYSLDSLVSGAVSDLAAGLDLCGNVPNFELPVGATTAVEKPKAVLQPTIEPEKEIKISKKYPATVELNSTVSESKTAAATKVESFSATPSEEDGKVSGAYKTATNTETITYESETVEAVTHKEAITTTVETTTVVDKAGAKTVTTTSKETATSRTSINAIEDDSLSSEMDKDMEDLFADEKTERVKMTKEEALADAEEERLYKKLEDYETGVVGDGPVSPEPTPEEYAKIKELDEKFDEQLRAEKIERDKAEEAYHKAQKEKREEAEKKYKVAQEVKQDRANYTPSKKTDGFADKTQTVIEEFDSFVDPSSIELSHVPVKIKIIRAAGPSRPTPPFGDASSRGKKMFRVHPIKNKTKHMAQHATSISKSTTSGAYSSKATSALRSRRANWWWFSQTGKKISMIDFDDLPVQLGTDITKVYVNYTILANYDARW